MKDQKLNPQQYCSKIKLFKIKLALQTPQQNHFNLKLLNMAKVMKVDLEVISKLPGINRDHHDWYLVEASGTFDNLSLTIACWQELGVKKYLAISSENIIGS
ncbi:MAG: hypothetical protein RLZZ04_1843 [Cyanobacteriota bacterium]|jgi:hypothetical protein